MDVLNDYLNKVINEHSDKPKFIAFLTAALTPIIDCNAKIQSMSSLFALSVAVGDQLDKIGLWLGRSRNIPVTITGTYFTFNTGPGFNVGALRGEFYPGSGITVLPDQSYRLYLQAVALANRWDGTIPGAYAAYDVLFLPLGMHVEITDNENMTATYNLVGSPDAVTAALFRGGFLGLEPAGIIITRKINGV